MSKALSDPSGLFVTEFFTGQQVTPALGHIPVDSEPDYGVGPGAVITTMNNNIY